MNHVTVENCMITSARSELVKIAPKMAKIDLKAAQDLDNCTEFKVYTCERTRKYVLSNGQNELTWEEVR